MCNAAAGAAAAAYSVRAGSQRCSRRGYYLRPEFFDRVMQLNWLHLCDICQLADTTETVTEHSARLQPLINLHDQVTAFMFSCSGTDVLPRRDKGTGKALCKDRSLHSIFPYFFLIENLNGIVPKMKISLRSWAKNLIENQEPHQEPHQKSKTSWCTLSPWKFFRNQILLDLFRSMT